MRFFWDLTFFLPQTLIPAQQAISSVTHTHGPWCLTPISQLHREEATSTLSEVSLFLFNFSHLLFPPRHPSTCSLTHSLSHSPALLHTSLVVNDTITSSLHPQLTGIELKESVMTFLYIFTEWVSGNALPNINEANQKAAAATVSLHIYIYRYINII